MAVSLYTSRLLLSALGVVDYGLYNVVGGVVVMLGFLQGTMSTASSRFVTVALSHNDINQTKNVFSNIFLINIFLALVVILLSETIGLWFLQEKMTIPESRLHASYWVYHCSVISVALSILTVPFNATIIAHEKMGAFAYISLFDAFAKLVVVYLIIISSYDRLALYAVLILLIHLIDVIIYVLYCIKNFVETKTKLVFDKKIIKEIFSFIIWASYGSFVTAGFTQGLNIILNLFFSPVVNAARGIAVLVQNAVVNFTTNFQTAINPQLIKLTAQQNFTDAQRLLIASSKYSFFLLCILGIPLIVETPFVLGLWLKEIPDYSISFCRIILIISIWESLANPLRIVNQAEGNIRKFQLYECTLLLLIMPISYVVLMMWHIPILVFVVHLIIEFCAQIVRIIIVLPKIRMSIYHYFSNVYMKIIPVFILPFIAIYFCKSSEINPSLRFVFITCTVELVIILSIYVIGLNSKERSFLYNYFHKMVYKKYDKSC